MININEIFYSLQGEGFWTGLPAVFVRLSGCNLKCDFCDTDHTSSSPMTEQQIVDLVIKYPAKTVILTGGEPLMQPIGALVDLLHKAGKRIHIETNGTFKCPYPIDWITCSPKYKPVVLDRIDELKIVYQGQDVESIRKSCPETQHNFLQPCSGKNIESTIDYIKANPHWRLSLQTHKLINIR